MACTYYGKHFGDNQNAVTEEGDDDASGRPGQFFKNFPSSESGFNNFMHENGSFLSFDHPVVQGVHDPNSSSSTSNSQLLQDFGCVQSTSSYIYMNNNNNNHTTKENKQADALGWADYKIGSTNGTNQGFSRGESCSNKRPHSGENMNMQAVKKQCNNTTKKNKQKSATTTPTKDPQSLAAKNRRERISERLKVLQELVPNGCKVDLVTMLEKAIGYVKFLQLQVKVLATDDFWPVQGGKAPDLSQVKNCIDAILSSQRDTNSSSK